MTCARNALKQQFTAQYFPNASLNFLASDMSGRIYDRIRKGQDSFVIMDDKNIENITKFITIQNLLMEKNIRVPEIYGKDLEHGFLILEDFGDLTLTKAIKQNAKAYEKPYYLHAIDILKKIREEFEDKPAFIEDYSKTLLLQEIMIFIDFYFQHVHNIEADEHLKKDWYTLWENVFDKIENITSNTLVLRDYHVDNLMILKNNDLGLLDFQDALWGSVMYDYISLVEDARRALSDELKCVLRNVFFDVFDKQHHPDYGYAADVLGAGRHAKVLGVFTRYNIFYKNDTKLFHLQHILNLLHQALIRAGESEILYFLKDQHFLKENKI
jgi:aminoglycoside/choline kinase family phosphotransferase